MERVLYVDDEDALVRLATRLLGRFGYEVEGYTDARQALQVFRSRPDEFAFVVTDLSMPGLSGFDLTSELLRIRPNISVVMTSGYVNPEDEACARRVGVARVVLKPNTMQELSQTLDQVFREVRTGGPASGAI